MKTTEFYYHLYNSHLPQRSVCTNTNKMMRVGLKLRESIFSPVFKTVVWWFMVHVYNKCKCCLHKIRVSTHVDRYKSNKDNDNSPLTHSHFFRVGQLKIVLDYSIRVCVCSQLQSIDDWVCGKGCNTCEFPLSILTTFPWHPNLHFFTLI